ncbi:MAG: hypothetical protein PGN11_09565 [Quadrisphaera sp.]
MSLFDPLVDAATTAALPGATPPRIYFWHGLSTEVVLSAVTVALGSVLFWKRDAVDAALARLRLPDAGGGLRRRARAAPGARWPGGRRDAQRLPRGPPGAAAGRGGGAGRRGRGGARRLAAGAHRHRRPRELVVLALLVVVLAAAAATSSAVVLVALVGARRPGGGGADRAGRRRRRGPHPAARRGAHRRGRGPWRCAGARCACRAPEGAGPCPPRRWRWGPARRRAWPRGP